MPLALRDRLWLHLAGQTPRAEARRLLALEFICHAHCVTQIQKVAVSKKASNVPSLEPWDRIPKTDPRMFKSESRNTVSPLSSWSFFRKSKALAVLAVLCTAMEPPGHVRGRLTMFFAFLVQVGGVTEVYSALHVRGW